MTAEKMDALILKPVDKWYGATVEIPTELIKPDPDNLRREFNE